MAIVRRRFLQIAAGALGSSFVYTGSCAKDYPSRPVRLLIGFLRHPDPVVAETARQALAYLENLGSRSEAAKPPKPQHLNRFHNQKE